MTHIDLSAEGMYDGFERLARAGETRLIGIELGLSLDGGTIAHLDIWRPARELIIPNVRSGWGHILELPVTVHTLHGDLRLKNAALG